MYLVIQESVLNTLCNKYTFSDAIVMKWVLYFSVVLVVSSLFSLDEKQPFRFSIVVVLSILQNKLCV